MGRSERNSNGKDSRNRNTQQGKKNYSRTGAPKKKQSNKPSTSADGIRLNRYIASSGICSRRDADIYIVSGNVLVNEKPVVELGYRVKTGDQVRFDGKLISPEKKEYILLNKPKGFTTTANDERGKRTTMDLVSKASKARLSAVGKLEKTSTGLILFTNDNELTKKLMHSGKNVRKIYHVELNMNVKAADLDKIREGLIIDDRKVKVEEVSYIENASKREIGLKIFSNRNKIVQYIFEELGYEIVKLDRVVFAGLTKKDLPRGHWRPLNSQEVINLKML